MIWADAANDAFQARVDTGATTSISAQEITIFERNGKNWVRFFLSHQEMDDKIQIEAPWCVTCGPSGFRRRSRPSSRGPPRRAHRRHDREGRIYPEGPQRHDLPRAAGP